MTGVLADPVLAGSSVVTGLVCALIDVGVTSLALPARITVTGPVVDLVPAPTSVTAGILELAALVNINLAVFPVVAGLTDTADIIDEIHTAAIVLTRGLAIRGMLESTRLISM